eukprot:1137260-Pelagomonas_calceolata.AAC.3
MLCPPMSANTELRKIELAATYRYSAVSARRLRTPLISLITDACCSERDVSFQPPVLLFRKIPHRDALRGCESAGVHLLNSNLPFFYSYIGSQANQPLPRAARTSKSRAPALSPCSLVAGDPECAQAYTHTHTHARALVPACMRCRRPGAQPQTLETAELAMRNGRNMPEQSDLRLVPKSVKEAALRNAEERGVREHWTGMPWRCWHCTVAAAVVCCCLPGVAKNVPICVKGLQHASSVT